MISIFWTYTWWGDGDLASIAAILHSFLYECTWILMITLLIYYFATRKKRYLLQTVLGIPCALTLIGFYFTAYPRIYEIIGKTIPNSPLPPKFSPSVLWSSFLLAAPFLIAVLAAVVLCIYNLIQKRLFSKKQILWICVPIWACLAIHVVIRLIVGGSPNRLIGIPELILAILLTLTLFGKRTPKALNSKDFWLGSQGREKQHP